jgi:RimJ/RimL family protein N-acetyltransferase
VTHFHVLHVAGKQMEIGYSLVPIARGKGYCTEAVKIMVDYLFLSREADAYSGLHRYEKSCLTEGSGENWVQEGRSDA